jgi:branched-chain amino acid transport system ATP-binding protein
MGAQSAQARQQLADSLEQVFALFPRLKERVDQLAGTLSGGEQQMVAIGRGLASRPKLLMLDEPSMGLAPAVADAIFERIEQIHRDNRVTVLLVEQRVGEALEACDYGYVLETGRLVLQGTHAQLLQNPDIKKAYLGM